VGFKPYLQDQLVFFSALTLLVWSYDMTYNVFDGTLNLAQSINQSDRKYCIHFETFCSLSYPTLDGSSSSTCSCIFCSLFPCNNCRVLRCSF